MKTLGCEEIQELLPEWMAGVLDNTQEEAVAQHLSGCAACQKEEALLRGILNSRPQAPKGLEARIQARVRQEFHGGSIRLERGVSAVRSRRWRRWTPTWALSAAALAVVSLGIGVLWNGQSTDVSTDPLEVAVQEPLPEAWLWDDGVVAGGPVYDDLTDEELQALIEELEG